MLLSDEKPIVLDYKKAFANYKKDKKIVDLNKVIAKKLDCVLFRLEDSLRNIDYTVPPYRHSHHRIVYMTKGKGQRIIGKVKVHSTKQTLVIIPGHTITSGTFSTDTRGYFLSFNPKFFLQNHFPKHHLEKMDFFRLEMVPYAQLDTKLDKTLTRTFETLLDEREHQRVNRNEMMALKILELLIICERVFRKTGNQAKKTMPPLIIDYLNLIQKHYAEHHSVRFYAEKLFVHPNMRWI